MRDRLVDDLQSIELRQHSVKDQHVEAARKRGRTARLAVKSLFHRMTEFA